MAELKKKKMIWNFMGRSLYLGGRTEYREWWRSKLSALNGGRVEVHIRMQELKVSEAQTGYLNANKHL